MKKINKLLYLILCIPNLLFAAADDDEMNFSIHKDCSNISSCSNYILASGKLTDNTPQIFSDFLANNTARGPIYFNSVGGKLEGGIKLGELIRKEKLNTYVGNIYKEIKNSGSKTQMLTVVNQPVCYSSCAYAFLGGVQREITENAKYGIHNFRSETMNNSYLQTRLVNNYIKNYLSSMDINQTYLELVSETSPKDMYILTREQAQLLNVDNSVIKNQIALQQSNVELEKIHTDNIKEVGENGLFKIQWEKENKNYLLSYEFRPESSSLGLLNKIYSDKTLFNLSIDGIPYMLFPKDDWTVSGKGVQVKFELNQNMINFIKKANKLEFVASWNKESRFNPSIAISTSNLTILKNNIN